MRERAVDPHTGRSAWKGGREAERPAWGWILQAVTGVLVLVLITVHMVANHFIVSRGLRDYRDVVAYLSNPIVVVWELVFLIAVSYTHLRAHETRHDLVCRLLLEKKK